MTIKKKLEKKCDYVSRKISQVISIRRSKKTFHNLSNETPPVTLVNMKCMHVGMP